MSTRLNLLRAFPASLERTVTPAIDSLGDDWWTSEDTLDPIEVRGETIHIPVRIYETDRVIELPLGSKRARVRACLQSRHSDGHVRQTQLSRLLERPTEWSLPYLVQLVGEYIVEIHEEILAGIDAIPPALVEEFAAANPKFIAKTKQRVISYWQKYHRGAVPLEELASTKIIGHWDWWTRRDLPSRLERQRWR